MTTHMKAAWKWPVLSIALLAFASGASMGQVPHQPCPVGGYAAVSCPVTTDEVIRYVLESRLAGVVASPGMPITVTVENGIVTMVGPVADESRRELATYIAQTTRGVAGVRNLLVLEGPTALDLQLAATVVETINRLPVNTTRVRVYVDHGVVTLEGVVRSELAKTQIELATEFIRGVTAVHNQLIVEYPGSGLGF